jgi:hypothetical protein
MCERRYSFTLTSHESMGPGVLLGTRGSSGSIEMRLFLTEIVAISAVGLAVVLLVFSFGFARLPEVGWSSAPGPDQGRYCHDRDLTALGGSAIRGQALLCIDEGSVEATLIPERLATGHVYTAWLLYASDPTSCQTTPCEGAGPSEQSEHWVRARIDGVIADGTRAARLSSTYRALHLAQRSQVLLVLVDAGEPRAGAGPTPAHLILLPPPTLLEAATVPSANVAPDVDTTAGTVVARALITMLETGR